LKRFSAGMFGSMILLGASVLLSACAGGSGASTPAQTGAGSSPSAKTVPAAVASATATPVALTVAQLGSVKDRWHKAVASVSVRGESLVVRVKRELTSAETDSLAKAASAANKKYGLGVTQLSVIFDKNGYMLGYQPIR